MQPDATSAIPQLMQDNLCYQYRYDWKQRLTQKKLPGKGWEFMVYNPIDQVILTQDANQRSVTPQVMSMMKYDGQGRVIITGQYLVSGISADVTNLSVPNQQWRQSLENTYQDTNNSLWESKSSTGIGYTTNAGPAINGNNYYTINYYDDYTAPGLPAAYATGNGTTILQTRGLATASKTMILNTLGNATPDMLWAVQYYDPLARNVQSYRQHYLGGTASLSLNNYDVIGSTYDFANEVTATTRKHFNTTSTTTPVLIIGNTYTYDHMGRKTQTFEQLNGGTNVLLSQLTFNETGQLNKKQLHSENSGSTYLQAIAYAYNERGWLLQSSAPLFEEQLQYNVVNTVSGITPTAQYNGNIASQSWGTSATQNSKSYIYLYDRLNRLTKGSSPTTGFNYQEKSIAYDLAGNIQGLQRYWNNTLIDQLAYKYIDAGSNYSNQLQSVTDTSTDASVNGYKSGTYTYAYDYNGNLETDNSRGITGTTGITYNLLNLPQTISSKSITYTYDATGRKLRRVNGSVATDYIDGIEYDSGSINFVQTEEGRAINSGGSYTNYEYTLVDHLGDSRVSFDRSGGGSTPKQVDDYLPFGLDIQSASASPPNKYLYNKKELQDGLTMYDYGARFYDPIVGRWTTSDPKSEAYPNWSPFIYTLNNSIRFIDPKGEDVYLIVWGTHDGEIGHAGIAVDNYKTEDVKDKNGKTKLDKNGKPITRQVKDGTVTYHDLWPGNQGGVGKSNFDQNVQASYGDKITTVDALMNTDISGSEGRNADGVLKLTTTASTDGAVVDGLNAFENVNPSYNGLRCNCSDFAKEGILYGAPSGSPVTDYREQIGSTNATTPNQLWKAASQLKNATVLKDPGTNVKKTFIEGVTGGGLMQKAAERKIN